MFWSCKFVTIVFLLNGELVYANVETAEGCNNSSSARVEYKYNTDVISTEHIITFNGYFMKSTREKYVAAALYNIGITNWTILQRNNPAKEFPSDFDVIILEEGERRALNALKDHPAVRRVTIQRQVQRTIKYIRDDDCGSSSCLYSGWRNHRARNIRSFRQPRENGGYTSRKLLRTVPRQITSVLKADVLWSLGVTGEGIRVAVFDTGLARHHPHFGRVRERTDWTGENTLDDALGHGTFVAGVIASRADCLGFAPDADLHIFRVFTDNQVSYTSWFLDAFNYAIMRKIDILNLSIGGPDFMDHPFVDKVWELSANKVIMVSAIGNDGPLYGTLNNPADQMDVIGVGGIGFDDRIAKFSSRGMTTWELPHGYGRMKPDIVTYGSGVQGSSVSGGCRSLSGTSVASPVVAGAIALLASGVPRHHLSPASVKQALCITARRLNGPNMFEQGHGKLDLISAYQFLREYTPQASLSPPYIDLTECQYMWPYCTQPLYYSAQPTITNVTVINGLGVAGEVKEVSWHPHLPHGGLLSVSSEHSQILWPWSGWLALSFSVSEAAADFDGVIEGHVNVTIESHTDFGERTLMNVTLMLPIRARVIPVPVRSRRLLWDQFHSLRYPGGYFPRDDLRAKHDPLDWHADHVHTNFRDMYRRLREHGFYLEVMGTPLTCIDTSLYGALLLVDPEDEYFPEEMSTLKKAVDAGLSLVVFADWYNASLLRHVKFYDENTRQWWIPETGGANVPALNDLLSMYQVALGDRVFEGSFKLGGHPMYYASGTHIHSFPEHGVLITARLSDQGHQIMSGEKLNGGAAAGGGPTVDVPILGLLQTDTGARDYANDTLDKLPKAGRLVVYGDSSCLEGGAARPCHWLLLAALQYALVGHLPSVLKEAATPTQNRLKDVHIIPSDLPKRAEGGRLHVYSRVLSPDGSGPRPAPPCPSASPVPPQPVHAPPAARTLAPRHQPTDPKSIGAPEMEGTEAAPRTWRGAGAAPSRAHPGLEPQPTGTASRAITLLAIIAIVYCITTLWKRCGRKIRRRRLMSLAT
ncbi:membrane-bound transcription factor site-1 protease [Plodia interpunctella]|uniref:membrane-bound transcription factor site-1 protease n=1 Tax=Plodia interpunctella TaxID=58824 RepID=UPI00236859D3|nr:membrane-bound transcription factor site-1 protease [Plodia interpunctella]